MKKFETPEMELRMFVREIVLTASGNAPESKPTPTPSSDYIIGPGEPNLPAA